MGKRNETSFLENMMNILGMEYKGNGWMLVIEFPEKMRNKEHIIQEVFYPNILTTKKVLVRIGRPVDDPLETIENINCNFPEHTQKAFGSITIKGFVKFIPQYEQMKDKNSRYYARHTNQEYSNISPLPSQLPDLRLGTIPMGFKTELEKQYPLEYIYSKGSWIPKPVWDIFNQMKRDEKKAKENSAFYNEFMEANTQEDQMRVLHKHTVPFNAVVQKKEEIPHEYITVPFPQANGAVSNYAAVSNAKQSAPNFKLPEGETPWIVYETLQKIGAY